MTIPRLEAHIVKKKNELADLKIEKQTELVDTKKVEKLEALVDYWKEKAEKTEALLSQKNSRIDKQDMELAALQNDNNYLRSMRSIGALEKFHSIKATVEPCMVERVTEKKVTEKFGPQQLQESKIPSQLILCPQTGEHVEVEYVCKKTCDKVVECRYYMQIVENRMR